MTFEPCVDCQRYNWKGMDWEREETLKCEDGNYRCVLHAPKYIKSSFKIWDMENDRMRWEYIQLVQERIKSELQYKKCDLRGVVYPYHFRCGTDALMSVDVNLESFDISESEIEDEFDLNCENINVGCFRANNLKVNGRINLELRNISMLYVYGGEFKNINFKLNNVEQMSVEKIFCENIFEINIKYNKYIFLKSIDSKKIILNGSFEEKVHFYRCCVRGKNNFDGAIFNKGFMFDECVFDKEVRFEKSISNGEVEFNRIGAKDVFDLRGIKNNENRIKFQNCDESFLSNIVVSSIEIEFIYFYNCKIPERLQWEDDQKFTLEQKVDCYRGLKKNAILEQNQPLVSRWHRKEWEMRLNGICEKRPRTFWASPEWLYSFVSGFGEDIWQAFFVLLAVFLGAFYGCLLLASLDCSGLACLEKTLEFIGYCMPLSKAKFAEGIGAGPKLFFWFSQVLISLQAGMLAFALRNKFRRQ